MSRSRFATQPFKRLPLTLHAGTLFFYPFVLILLSLMTQHPLFLLALLLATGTALMRVGAWGALRQTLRFVWPVLLILLVINVLISKNGATVLWNGPKVIVFGQIRLTLEALVYGWVLILRMLVVLAACTLYIAWLSPDRALGLMAKWAGRSAVTAMMTARLLPYLGEQAAGVGDVLQTRGVRFQEGGLWQRLKARRSMLNVLLISSLEGSWQVAEAMEARGFGQGKRTSYSRERWTKRDLYVWLLLVAALLLAGWLALQGVWDYAFYPRLTAWFADGMVTIAYSVLLLLLLVLPLFLMKRRKR